MSQPVSVGSRKQRIRASLKDFPEKVEITDMVTCWDCGKPNIKKAKFCGNCGNRLISATFSPETPGNSFQESEPTEGLENHENIVSDGNCKIQAGFSSRNGLWESQIKENTPQKKKPRIPVSWFRKQIRQRGLMILVAGLLLPIFMPTFAFYSPFSRFKKDDAISPVIWSDMRSHISRHVGLTLQEVDCLAEASLGEVPKSDANMTCDDAKKVEEFLISASGVEISLFQNLQPTVTLQKRHMQESDSQNRFITFRDVPLDHPVYVAWRALLQLGIFPIDSQNRVRVHEPIFWEDWRAVIETIDKRLELGGLLQDQCEGPRTGPMSGIDLRDSLTALRLILHMQEMPPFEGVNPDFIPTRLEAFGAVSQLIEEKASQG